MSQNTGLRAKIKELLKKSGSAGMESLQVVDSTGAHKDAVFSALYMLSRSGQIVQRRGQRGKNVYYSLDCAPPEEEVDRIGTGFGAGPRLPFFPLLTAQWSDHGAQQQRWYTEGEYDTP